MTEAEWESCTDPTPMLEFLHGRPSERKLRLFGCACCRQIWDFLTDQRCRTAVEQAERYAEGLASKRSLTPVRVEARQAVRKANAYWRRRAFHACLKLVEDKAASAVAAVAAQNAFRAVQYSRGMHQAARGTQAALLRDIFGPLPFRAVHIAPSLLTKNDSLLPQLARAAYENRSLPAGTLDEARLLVLADALEDAGLTDAEVLGHLRSGGPHVRGCWVVDAVLGQK
jgi:hypothetical protein